MVKRILSRGREAKIVGHDALVSVGGFDGGFFIVVGVTIPNRNCSVA